MTCPAAPRRSALAELCPRFVERARPHIEEALRYWHEQQALELEVQQAGGDAALAAACQQSQQPQQPPHAASEQAQQQQQEARQREPPLPPQRQLEDGIAEPAPSPPVLPLPAAAAGGS